MAKRVPLSGYRLHIKRLKFAADSNTAATRTFKFPLTADKKIFLNAKKQRGANFTNVPEWLVEAVKHDDLYIRGPSNLVDYLKYKDKEIYTLIDFWLDSLRAGVVFMPSTLALANLVTKLKDGKTVFEKIVDDADPRFSCYFDTSRFIDEFVAKGEMRKSKTRTSFVKTMEKILRKDLSEQEKEDANRFIEELSGAFFDNENLKIIGSEAQNKIWREFGLDKGAVDLKFDLTFFIFPELAEGEDVVVTPGNVLGIFDSLVARRIKWFIKYGYSEEESKRQLDKILGMSDNFNAFSNYFGSVLPSLKEGKVDDVLKLLNKLYPKIGELERKKLIWLSKKVQRLAMPKVPGVNGWHEYRSLVGGKLQSWWSNHKNRKDEQAEQIQSLKKQIPRLKKFIYEYPNDDQEIDEDMRNQRIFEVEQLLEKIQKAIEFPKEIFADIKRYEYLESLIKSLRQKLNEYFQLYVKGDTDQNPGDFIELKEFWGIKIYKPRSFYGYAQREKLKKIVEDTIPTIKQGILLTHHLLKTLLPLVEWDKSIQEKEGIRKQTKRDVGLRRFLEALRRKIKDDKLNTKKFREFYIKTLQKYLPDRDVSYLTDKRLQQYTFYRSSYSTSTQKVIDLPENLDYTKEAKELVKHLVEFLLSFSKDNLLDNPSLLLDFIETAKFAIARMFRWMNQERAWDLDQFKFGIFPAARDFVEQLKENSVKTPMVRLIIMSTMFSEFRGAAIVVNKKYVTAKWNVQVVGSDKKFKLTLTPRDNEIEVEDFFKKIQSHNFAVLKQIRWNVLFPALEGDRKQMVVLADKNGNFRLSKEKVTRDTLLQICTSKHHLQFLERLIYKPNSWTNIKIRVSEPSLIVEERYKVKWDIQNGLPKLTDYKANKPRLYYVLPLQFSVKKDRTFSLLSLAQIKDDFQNNPKESLKKYHFLGADIGEYGIAWVVLRIDEDSGIIEVKEYGFEYDKQIKKIQDEFKEIQQKARLGVFLEDITILAKLRENAIGYLRNRLHDKLINYGGHIIYEANISGFEMGVGRITKIYDSVKRADVGNHPDMGKDVGKKLVQHIWGIKAGGKKNSPGWQVGAAGTSYTCISCGQTIYGLGKDNDKWSKVKVVAPSIYGFRHPQEEIIVYGYKEGELPDYCEYKDVRRYARMFARPPLVKADSENRNKYPAVIEKFVIKRGVLTPEQLQSIKNKRGNSALFVCPFEGCNTVVDADIQAAVVIALRGYLYVKEFHLNRNKEPFKDTKDKLLVLTKQMLNKLKLKGKLDFIYQKK